MDLEIHDQAPERKAGLANTDALVTHDDLMRTFEAFKAENDERLAAVEKKRSDILLDEKVERLNTAVDQLMLKQARPTLEGARKAVSSASSIEHKQAFDTYIRAGESGGLRALETKALSAGSNPDGGYLVPDEIAQEIGRRLVNVSPIRSIADVREVSGTVFKKPFMTAGPAVGWVGETGARTQTTSPTIGEISFPAMELYAMPAATPTLLEDAAVNVDQWLAGEVELAFAEQEGAAFVNGDGTNKPTGFLNYTKVAESAWSWGNLGYVATGADAAFPSTSAADPLIDLVFALKAGYRQNGSFVMNRKTQAQVRKLKDNDGLYLWQPPAQLGARASLMTFPVVEAEDMPDIASDSFSIAFGDFRRGYLIVDRQGVRVLRDPFSAKPYVLFYTTKRVGGGVQDFDAIKLLKFGES